MCHSNRKNLIMFFLILSKHVIKSGIVRANRVSVTYNKNPNFLCVCKKKGLERMKSMLKE